MFSTLKPGTNRAAQEVAMKATNKKRVRPWSDLVQNMFFKLAEARALSLFINLIPPRATHTFKAEDV
jgi:hypothetical protein